MSYGVSRAGKSLNSVSPSSAAGDMRHISGGLINNGSSHAACSGSLGKVKCWNVCFNVGGPDLLVLKHGHLGHSAVTWSGNCMASGTVWLGNFNVIG